VALTVAAPARVLPWCGGLARPQLQLSRRGGPCMGALGVSDLGIHLLALKRRKLTRLDLSDTMVSAESFSVCFLTKGDG